MPDPKTEKDAMCHGLKGFTDSNNNNVIPIMASTAPTAWDIALNGSLIFI